MNRKLIALVMVLLAALVAVPVMAQDEDLDHLFGVVFYDADMDGMWDAGEVGAEGVPVYLESADGRTEIQLTSSEDGTWGLIPAGGVGARWRVWADPPAGYYVTSESPQWATSVGEGDETLVYLGLAPTAAGGPMPGTDEMVVVAPVTGAPSMLYAAGMLALSGAGLLYATRRRK